jgi:hypothetical protein
MGKHPDWRVVPNAWFGLQGLLWCQFAMLIEYYANAL